MELQVPITDDNHFQHALEMLIKATTKRDQLLWSKTIADLYHKNKKRLTEPAHPLPDVGEVEERLRLLVKYLEANSGINTEPITDALALIASLKGKHAETRGLVRDLTACLENRNKEIANLKADVERLTGERDGHEQAWDEVARTIGDHSTSRIVIDSTQHPFPLTFTQINRACDRLAKPKEERHG